MTSDFQNELDELRRQKHAEPRPPQKVQYVHDWEAHLPAGSIWTPGSHGQPGCPICKGMGWLRKELPTYHADFGKLVFCDCVPRETHAKLAEERNSKGYTRQDDRKPR